MLETNLEEKNKAGYRIPGLISLITGSSSADCSTGSGDSGACGNVGTSAVGDCTGNGQAANVSCTAGNVPQGSACQGPGSDVNGKDCGSGTTGSGEGNACYDGGVAGCQEGGDAGQA